MIKTCEGCGYTRNTSPAAQLCTKCEQARRIAFYKKQWEAKLEEMQYDLLQYDAWVGIHTDVTVYNRKCQHKFTSKLHNILSGMTVCGHCGPLKRWSGGLAAYKKKYGRTYDLALWRDYRHQARHLSEQVYKTNKHLLNPQDLPRRLGGTLNAVQLDHIIPIIYGFKNSLPVELIAHLKNLRIVLWQENLSKKSELTEQAKTLLAELLAP